MGWVEAREGTKMGRSWERNAAQSQGPSERHGPNYPQVTKIHKETVEGGRGK